VEPMLSKKRRSLNGSPRRATWSLVAFNLS